MKYKKIYPKQSINHIVKFFWIFEGDFGETSLYYHSSVASVYPRLAFQYIPGMMVLENAVPSRLFVSGFQSQSNSYYQLCANQNIGVFGVYFQPYAISLLFDIPANEITNHNIEISDLLGKEGTILEEQVLECRSTQERISLLTRFIEKRLTILPPNGKNTISLIHHLILRDGKTKIQELLSAQFISQRQLERNFKTLTGFSPKHFSRIVRFEKSILNAFNNSQSSLTELALHSGYFDQAHMIRDYRAFTGKNPSTYFSEDQSLFITE